MNANDQFFARDAKVDSAAVAPLPASRKIHVEGTRPDDVLETAALCYPRAIPTARRTP